ncbi:MAG TPA: hypothetical protein VHU82_10080, partial [Vicinamibacterales bacterium]|nr:hypothetical protein [Vicinamibacterales bacterium]
MSEHSQDVNVREISVDPVEPPPELRAWFETADRRTKVVGKRRKAAMAVGPVRKFIEPSVPREPSPFEQKR